MPPRVKATPVVVPDRRELLPLAQVLAELGDENGPLPRGTFDAWRRRNIAPKVIKLPNGELRVDRVDLNAWLESRVEQQTDAA